MGLKTPRQYTSKFSPHFRPVGGSNAPFVVYQSLLKITKEEERYICVGKLRLITKHKVLIPLKKKEIVSFCKSVGVLTYRVIMPTAGIMHQ